MLGELTALEIDKLLNEQMVGRIGCFAEDKIFVVPITYVYKDGYIYGHSRDGQKIEMMRKNPRVCFEVDFMKHGLTVWQSAILWGEYEEMEKEEEKMSVLKFLTDRLASLEPSETMMKPAHHLPNPHPHNAGIKAIAFRIKVIEKTGRFEDNNY